MSSPPSPQHTPLDLRAHHDEDGGSQEPSHPPKHPEEPLTERGRLKPHASSRWAGIGRISTRMGLCWSSPHIFLTCGLETLLNTDGHTMVGYSSEKKHASDTFLITVAPHDHLVEELINASDDDFKHIVSQIRVGQRGARSDDTSILKKMILCFVPFPDKSLAPSIWHKVGRGFYNATLALYLAPVDGILPLTEAYISALNAGTAVIREADGSEHLVDGTDFRLFMYAGNEYDPQNPLRGFLKGELIVKGFKCIFTSPSSADWDHYPRHSSKATRHGNAKIHGITKVSPGSIAYITTQVYFALTSNEVFAISNAPDIEQMYNTIYSFFDSEVPEIKAYASELLVWWNRTIFPTSYINFSNHTTGSMARLEARYREEDVPTDIEDWEDMGNDADMSM